MLAQSFEPGGHDKALDNNPNQIGILEMLFLRRAENRSTLRKLSRSKEENQQQTQPRLTPSPRIKPGLHWWEASALTTAPSLLP